MGVGRGITRVVRRLNKNGPMDGYKWFSGLLQMARRSNKKGPEGEHGWEEALMQMAERFIMISIVG